MMACCQGCVASAATVLCCTALPQSALAWLLQLLRAAVDGLMRLPALLLVIDCVARAANSRHVGRLSYAEAQQPSSAAVGGPLN